MTLPTESIGTMSKECFVDGNEIIVNNPPTRNECEARIAELRTMEDGWLDEEGIAPSPMSLDMAERYLDCFASRYPFIYPMMNGGIVFEWSDEDSEFYLEISPEGSSGYFHGIESQSGESISFEISFFGGGIDKIKKYLKI